MFSPSRSIPACAGEPPAASSSRRSSWVYPRVCGGTHRGRCLGDSSLGLSPRVRGNLKQIRQIEHSLGSIPACAGEPVAAAVGPARSGVYPRVCGGTGWVRVRRGVRPGLSPRVRGNRIGMPGATCRARSIPACAGEPQATQSASVIREVYPRVCGGTPGDPVRVGHPRGLSPRVRGNRPYAHPEQRRNRSIPACAGEPFSFPPPNRRIAVYPRVCGGTLSKSSRTSGSQGLSPRVRGNRSIPPAASMSGRSIPACAGEPWTANRPARSSAVYPRVCGGTVRFRLSQSHPEGLSPRVRGNQIPAGAGLNRGRSIPACAGEPAPGVASNVAGLTGLSPRVRGNPDGEAVRASHAGSIPACAGEPGSQELHTICSGVYPRVCGGTPKR